MDYSIHDAIKAGFNKIIFVIRKDIEADFRERIGDRIDTLCKSVNVEVAYAFQSREDVPGEVPEGREKPWGTGQAVLAAKEELDSSFAVINADDYYGKKAFQVMHDWLILDHAENAISMSAFVLKNTLSEHGGVTRGVCKTEKGHTHVLDIVETKNIQKTENGVEADGTFFDPNCLVSMNFWGFPGEPPKYVKMLEEGFAEFFKKDVPANPLKAEYLLPTHIGGLLREGKVTVKTLETTDKWFGVTYKEDKPYVVESFKKLIQNKVYEENLYSDL